MAEPGEATRGPRRPRSSFPVNLGPAELMHLPRSRGAGDNPTGTRCHRPHSATGTNTVSRTTACTREVGQWGQHPATWMLATGARIGEALATRMATNRDARPLLDL